MNQVPIYILEKHHNEKIKEIAEYDKLEHWVETIWIIATIITLITGALVINGAIPLRDFRIPGRDVPIYQLVPIAISFYDIIFTFAAFILNDICKHI